MPLDVRETLKKKGACFKVKFTAEESFEMFGNYVGKLIWTNLLE